ncbi:MAG: TrkH family potassium uptake protein [Candidatus ainarchaeum sp.]|jgi:trk system potassium uptake protein TrkH|nr:TrkH family potassium uptake protein [Candidatus ainarchaeum sp.]MDY0364056.1 TrkH family potassium uptake protein [Bacilli bacterium]
MQKDNSIYGYKLIIGYVGLIIFMLGIILLIPLVMIIFYPDEIIFAKNFIIPSVFSLLIGYLLSFSFASKKKGRLDSHQDLLLVVLMWIIAIVISAVPFLFLENYSITHSIFETTSGYSTTGLSIIDVEVTPHIYLFFRSLMQFFGGVGLVLVMTSVLSDRYGMRLYHAEGHSDKLLPNLIKSARVILLIYMIYIFLGTILYWVFGMNFFDALNHSISAVSTGGFSTKASSIGFYNSQAIEIITIMLMLLGSTNFLIHLRLFRGKIKEVFLHSETKLLICFLVVGIALFTLLFNSHIDGEIWNALRVGSFQLISALTTTGYQTINQFASLSSILIGFVILLMVIGGSIGSTAGGIKQYRIVIFFKSLYWSIQDRIISKKIIRTHYVNKVGKKIAIDESELKYIHNYIGIYIIILLIGTFIISAFGYSLESSLFEFASALGTVGLSMGVTSYSANPVVLWTLSVGMFLGRLEIYIVIISIIKPLMNLIKKEK